MGTRTLLLTWVTSSKRKYEQTVVRSWGPEARAHVSAHALEWSQFHSPDCKDLFLRFHGQSQEAGACRNSEEKRNTYLLFFSASTDTQRATQRGQTAEPHQRKWELLPTWEEPGPALEKKNEQQCYYWWGLMSTYFLFPQCKKPTKPPGFYI